MKKIGLIVFACCFAASEAAAQSGASYYVSPSGNDNIACTDAQNIETPMQTINMAISCLNAGDTLYVRGGTYAESLSDPGVASGTSWDNPVTIAAYPGNCSAGCETVWMQPPNGPGNSYVIYFSQTEQYIIFDGINIDYSNGDATNYMSGINITSGTYMGTSFNAHHIRFQNAEFLGNRAIGDLSQSAIAISFEALNTDAVGFNEVINCKIHGSGGSNASYGFYIQSGSNLVELSEFYDLGFQAGQFYDGWMGTATNNIFYGNSVHDIVTGLDDRRNGVLMAGNGNLAYDNLFWNINAGGIFDGNQTVIAVYGGFDANLVFNNTIINSVADAIGVAAGQTNTLIANNISYGMMGGAVNGVYDEGTGTIDMTNSWDVAPGADPLFVNPSGTPPDLRLQAGSPAIQGGTVLGAPYNIDILGNPRPMDSVETNYDIGAYQQ